MHNIFSYSFLVILSENEMKLSAVDNHKCYVLKMVLHACNFDLDKIMFDGDASGTELVSWFFTVEYIRQHNEVGKQHAYYRNVVLIFIRNRHQISQFKLVISLK